MALFSTLSSVAVGSLVVQAGVLTGLAEGTTFGKLCFIIGIGYFLYSQKPKTTNTWSYANER